jgi:hypothetical protein
MLAKLLSVHIKTSHVRAEQVAEFGAIMGVSQ